MTHALSPEVLANVPEGATHWADGMYFVQRDGVWWARRSPLPHDAWCEANNSGGFKTTGLTRLPTPDTSAPAQPVSDAGWWPMSDGLPTVCGVYLCLHKDGSEWYSWFGGKHFHGTTDSAQGCARACRGMTGAIYDHEIARYRLIEADPAPQAPVSTMIRKPAHKQEPDYICASDRAGIDSFKPADLPAPTQEKAPRVSTLRRAWLWL